MSQRFSAIWVPLALAALAFLIYWPSLGSDFVYDAHIEIIEEGFITSISNLPAVLSLKVLAMNLQIGDRPGQLLYLMLIAAVCGKAPFGYHLCSNLLHAANVALLYVFLRRLILSEVKEPSRGDFLKIQLTVAAATLIFALHPIAVETVANVSYSSDLLVTFFTLLALQAAMSFRPDGPRVALYPGIAAILCALAAVTCKESGLTTTLLLVVYWFLFRRGEAKLPWLCLLSAAVALTTAFLTSRLLFAPPSSTYLGYVGGSLSHAVWFQPRIWVFMLGKLIWPTQLSADYTVDSPGEISMPLAVAILAVVVSLQVWLAWKSRLGAFGVAIYWLGLATVSNFFPLYRPLADRFYYLPLAGLSLQLIALVLLNLKSPAVFWSLVTSCLIALVPLTRLTLIRERVFTNDFALWSDTVQATPRSSLAHSNLGQSFYERGRVDEAIFELQTALKIHPDYADAHYNLGLVRLRQEKADEAIRCFLAALESNPRMAQVHYHLGLALSLKGNADAEMLEYRKALEINPAYIDARNNLSVTLFQKGQMEEAIAQLQEALRLKPGNAELENNLAHMQAAMRQMKGAPPKR